MPSFFHVMVGLGGTALAVGVITLWLNEPRPSSSLPGASIYSARTAGKSALSHGGPSPHNIMAAIPSTAQFQIGQRLSVAFVEDAPHSVAMLPAPPHSTSSSTSGKRRTLPLGTVVIVSGMQATEPVPGRTELYYEVALPDGGKGWLSERVLRPAAN